MIDCMLTKSKFKNFFNKNITSLVNYNDKRKKKGVFKLQKNTHLW